MDPLKHDPVSMIAELAQDMVLEQRERFLSAACGSNAKLRQEVESYLRSHGSENGGTTRASRNETQAHDDPEPDTIESIALDAVSSFDFAEPNGDDETQADGSIDQTIDVFCDNNRLPVIDRLKLFQKVCLQIDLRINAASFMVHLHPLLSGSRQTVRSI